MANLLSYDENKILQKKDVALFIYIPNHYIEYRWLYLKDLNL